METVLSNALFRGVVCASPVAKQMFTTHKREINISPCHAFVCSDTGGKEATRVRVRHPIMALINSALYE